MADYTVVVPVEVAAVRVLVIVADIMVLGNSATQFTLVEVEVYAI